MTEWLCACCAQRHEREAAWNDTLLEKSGYVLAHSEYGKEEEMAGLPLAIANCIVVVGKRESAVDGPFNHIAVYLQWNLQ